MCIKRMHKIYRVETVDRIGLYRAVYAFEPGVIDLYSTDRHPTPDEDAGMRAAWRALQIEVRTSPYLFGFKSLDQLRCWIYKEEWRQWLKDKGLIIRVYNAADYILGDTQAVFNTAGHFYAEPYIIDLVTFEERIDEAEVVSCNGEQSAA